MTNSDTEHEQLDYKSIHEKIDGRIRVPVAVLGSEEERVLREQQLRERRLHLFELTKTEAHKKLFEGQPELAIPAALQSLRFSMDLFGQNSIELVPSYLLLGEASIGLKQYAQAEDYLSLAKWAVMKTTHCEPEVLAQLHRNFGLLYASQKMYQEALVQTASDVYYSSLTKGPEHISVSGGYFQLGNIFQEQSKVDNAVALYDRVVTIWKSTLKQGNTNLDEAQEAEAVHMLSTIMNFRAKTFTFPTPVAEVNHVLGLLYYTTGHLEKAKEYASIATEAYESAIGREHSMTMDCRHLLKTIMNDITAKALANRWA